MFRCVEGERDPNKDIYRIVTTKGLTKVVRDFTTVLKKPLTIKTTKGNYKLAPSPTSQTRFFRDKTVKDALEIKNALSSVSTGDDQHFRR